MSGWQPIETAPRDGTIVVGSWAALDGQMQLPVQWVDGGWHLAWACWGDESDDCEPLHWRPLPPDPV